MMPTKEPRPSKDQPSPKLGRLEEARRIIQEYADSLRKIIKTLHQRLN